MFAGLHHFQPDDARRILRNAFDRRCAIGVFEGTARTPAGIIGATLIPFGVLLMTPRIRPLTAFQLVFTYLIPLLPLMIYTPEEMRAMTADLQAPDYVWDCGMMDVPGTSLAVPYLTGRAVQGHG